MQKRCRRKIFTTFYSTLKMDGFAPSKCTSHGVNDDTMKSAFWNDDSESEFILEICQADYSAAIYRFLKGNWICSGYRFFVLRKWHSFWPLWFSKKLGMIHDLRGQAPAQFPPLMHARTCPDDSRIKSDTKRRLSVVWAVILSWEQRWHLTSR